jgi:hypothetical protein
MIMIFKQQFYSWRTPGVICLRARLLASHCYLRIYSTRRQVTAMDGDLQHLYDQALQITLPYLIRLFCKTGQPAFSSSSSRMWHSPHQFERRQHPSGRSSLHHGTLTRLPHASCYMLQQLIRSAYASASHAHTPDVA